MFARIRKAYATELTRQMMRYLVASALSAGVSLSLPIILHEGFGAPEEVAVATSLFLAYILNFFTLRIFVFRSAAALLSQIVKFGTLSAIFRLGEYLLFLGAFRILGLNYMIALILALAISFIGKFAIQRSFVFKA